MIYDAIIIGAGPSGTAVAYDLASAGGRVLLLDRWHFPRDKACAGGLTIKTLRALRHSVSSLIRNVSSELVVGKKGEATRTLSCGHPICAFVLRKEFDEYLLNQAISAGAVFNVIQHLQAIEEQGECVQVTVDDCTYTGRYLVGADGADSTVRRLVMGEKNSQLGFAMEVNTAWTGERPKMEIDFGVINSGYGWIFPRDDHINVGLYTSSSSVEIHRDDFISYVQEKSVGAFTSKIVGHHVGMGGGRNRLCTERVLLVGDAAGLVDPLLGEGIYHAIVSGQLAAKAIVAGMNGQNVELMFLKLMKPLLRELQSSTEMASWFYEDFERGYRWMTSPVVRQGLIRGFAAGMDYPSIRKGFALNPFLKFAKPVSIMEWKGATADQAG